MQCPNCATELLHPGPACPVCGHVLQPGAAAPTPTQTDPQPQNIVYLPQQPQVPVTQPPTLPPAVAPPAEGVTTNVLGEVVPETYYEGPQVGEATQASVVGGRRRGQRRLLGATLLGLAGAMLTIGFGVYAAGLVAEAGGFVLLAAFALIWYLTLVPERQHPRVMLTYRRYSSMVDRRIEPMRRRADVELTLRREREGYERMRRERARRVSDLGELAYRRYREGEVVESLAPHAQRVQSIEQKMLLQDRKVHELEAVRTEPAAKRRQRRSRDAGSPDDS